MMKTIPLTQGYVAIVDDEDYERLAAFKWHVHKPRNVVYAMRHIRQFEGRTETHTYMHREVLGCKRGQRADHRDGNGLNNVRKNLRMASYPQNAWNAPRYSNNTVGLKGVTVLRGRFQAQIRIAGKKTYLGMFGTAEEAHAAYRKAAAKHHKEFARFN